jgi:hypothetical protein
MQERMFNRTQRTSDTNTNGSAKTSQRQEMPNIPRRNQIVAKLIERGVDIDYENSSHLLCRWQSTAVLLLALLVTRHQVIRKLHLSLSCGARSTCLSLEVVSVSNIVIAASIRKRRSRSPLNRMSYTPDRIRCHCSIRIQSLN